MKIIIETTPKGCKWIKELYEKYLKLEEDNIKLEPKDEIKQRPTNDNWMAEFFDAYKNNSKIIGLNKQNKFTDEKGVFSLEFQDSMKLYLDSVLNIIRCQKVFTKHNKKISYALSIIKKIESFTKKCSCEFYGLEENQIKVIECVECKNKIHNEGKVPNIDFSLFPRVGQRQQNFFEDNNYEYLKSKTCFILEQNEDTEKNLIENGVHHKDVKKIKKALDIIFDLNQKAINKLKTSN